MFGLIQLLTNSLSDHPAAVKRVVPFRVHGLLEKWTGPTFASIAFLTGGFFRPKNYNFLCTQVLVSAAIFNLTDWNGDPDK